MNGTVETLNEAISYIEGTADEQTGVEEITMSNAALNPRFTAEQNKALRRKFDQHPSTFPTFAAFYESAQRSAIDSVVIVYWCGMWLGIETDGYTHS